MKAVTPTEECTNLLNEILTVQGQFDRKIAFSKLELLRLEASMSVFEYLNFVDALNNYDIDGHYENSLIWKRAKASEEANYEHSHTTPQAGN